MPDNTSPRTFYARVLAGNSKLVGHWLMLGQADPDRLAMILADTARIAKLGEPQTTPNGATLTHWSGDATPPRWAAKTSLFLLVQMPGKPLPRDDDEACAWAYCWLHNREFDTFETARDSLPAHLREPLSLPLAEAWQDYRGLRLV